MRLVVIMNDVNFYFLKYTNLSKALTQLLEKAIGIGLNILIRTNSVESTEEVDEILWSYNLSRFLPHSKLGDNYCSLSPIYITSKNENPNGSEYLFIVGNVDYSVAEICKFKRTFILFNNEDNVFLDWTRKLWTDLNRFEIKKKYWIEEKKGWRLHTKT